MLLACLALLGWHWFDPVALEVQRGNSLFRQMRYQEALRHYLKALSRKPLPQIHYNIGCCLYRLGRLDEAERAFLLALEGGESFPLRLKLGNLYFRKGLYDKAIEQYKRALRLEPSNIAAKINLELALRRKKVSPPPKKLPKELKRFLFEKEREVFRKKWKEKGKPSKKDW